MPPWTRPESGKRSTPARDQHDTGIPESRHLAEQTGQAVVTLASLLEDLADSFGTQADPFVPFRSRDGHQQFDMSDGRSYALQFFCALFPNDPRAMTAALLFLDSPMTVGRLKAALANHPRLRPFFADGDDRVSQSNTKEPPMASILDTATLLMPSGTYSSNQSFTPLLVYPRQLATTMLVISMTTPPVSSCTFVVEVATTSGGTYTTIQNIAWPAGISGSREVAFGVNSALAKFVNNQSLWMRLSLVTAGALTGSAWLSKPSDGSFGLATRSYHLDNLSGQAALLRAMPETVEAPPARRGRR